MALPKKIAAGGFYLCTSVFTALSVYGMVLYMGDAPMAGSTASAAAYGVGVFGSIAGIVYFGTQWDARKREEQQATAPAGKKR